MVLVPFKHEIFKLSRKMIIYQEYNLYIIILTDLCFSFYDFLVEVDFGK